MQRLRVTLHLFVLRTYNKSVLKSTLDKLRWDKEVVLHKPIFTTPKKKKILYTPSLQYVKTNFQN